MFDRARWTELLRDEITQRTEEGCEAAELLKRLELVKDPGMAEYMWEVLQALETRAGWVEPSDLEGIRAERAAGPRRLAPPASEEVHLDKVLGGWRGRVAGCQLGKPVEGWDRERIEAYLVAAKAHPLDDFIPFMEKRPDGTPGGMGDWWRGQCTRGNITFASRDDDQDYTILGLHLLEKHGAAVTPQHVADAWLDLFPYRQVYTAERETYRNLVEGLKPPASALRWNPYREWIGAQIRADGWGLASPGGPEQAAELGFRDASVSHVKNGIYGEMFFAAALAAAFSTDSLAEVIAAALGEIPAKSRFAAMVGDCLAWEREHPDWESAWRACAAKYGAYHWVHTLNNAALVLLALLYGKKDFGRTICLAVRGGWDTDCNGATAGAILGVMLGERAVPRQWTAPFNDRIQSALFGFAECRISDLAERTVAVGKKVSAG